ncbi:hypothetical protein LINPERHAP1_LOCUS13042 [Linum perenne]
MKRIIQTQHEILYFETRSAHANMMGA